MLNELNNNTSLNGHSNTITSFLPITPDVQDDILMVLKKTPPFSLQEQDIRKILSYLTVSEEDLDSIYQLHKIYKTIVYEKSQDYRGIIRKDEKEVQKILYTIMHENSKLQDQKIILLHEEFQTLQKHIVSKYGSNFMKTLLLETRNYKKEDSFKKNIQESFHERLRIDNIYYNRKQKENKSYSRINETLPIEAVLHNVMKDITNTSNIGEQETTIESVLDTILQMVEGKNDSKNTSNEGQQLSLMNELFPIESSKMNDKTKEIDLDELYKYDPDEPWRNR